MPAKNDFTKTTTPSTSLFGSGIVSFCSPAVISGGCTTKRLKSLSGDDAIGTAVWFCPAQGLVTSGGTDTSLNHWSFLDDVALIMIKTHDNGVVAKMQRCHIPSSCDTVASCGTEFSANSRPSWLSGYPILARPQVVPLLTVQSKSSVLACGTSPSHTQD